MALLNLLLILVVAHFSCEGRHFHDYEAVGEISEEDFPNVYDYPMYPDELEEDEFRLTADELEEDEFKRAATITVTTNPTKCLKAHNILRQRHSNTPNLKWDSQLADIAQKYAEKILAVEDFSHDPRNHQMGWGENIYMMNSKRAATCADAALAWYNEYKDYDFKTGKQKASNRYAVIGHFTQLVWETTTHVGVGIATKQKGENLLTYIIAKYKPQGNWIGEFTDNVHNFNTRAPVPKLHQLDPDLCSNVYPKASCTSFMKRYSCNFSAVKSGCYKECNKC